MTFDFQSFDFGPVLGVMDTLLSVSHQECHQVKNTDIRHLKEAGEPCVSDTGKELKELSSSTQHQMDQLPYLVRLLCSLQASLCVWCSEQVDSETGEMSKTAQTIIVQCEFF